MTTEIDLEPHTQQESLLPTSYIAVGAEFELDVYQLPDTPGRRLNALDMIGTDNSDGLGRVFSDGLDALQDGETIRIAGLSKHSDHSKVTTFTRVGDMFTVDQAEVPVRMDVAVEPVGNRPTIQGHGNAKKFFSQEFAIPSSKPGLGLVEKGGKLGQLVASLGFTANEVPLPHTLEENINRERAGGAALPNVKLTTEAAIEDRTFNAMWANDEYGISEQPSYYIHDVLGNHFRSLLVFRHNARIIPSLYAKAVDEATTIVGRLPATDYEVNKDRVELMDVALSGAEKEAHAALCLDNFTPELDALVKVIDEEPTSSRAQAAFSEFPAHRWRYTPQMVNTILSSSYRQEFIDYLTEQNSQAFDEASNTFSYETFMREVFEEAQSYWEITPSSDVAPLAESNGYTEDTSLLIV